ncbi:MAG: flavin reductase family protein [Candidatus Zixiibacteriota bacterium]|nr:MAG: flavin reductase family protein [candidate division Zixibacteria bacterium]
MGTFNTPATENKKKLTSNLLSPLPVVLLGTLVNDRPNYMVVGYVSPFDFGRYVFLSLYKKRYTRIGLHEHKTFSLNMPSEALLKEINICGSRSGRDINKAELFDNFYGDLKTAPMIRECPLNMECELHQVLDYGENEGIIGRVVKSYADRDCLDGDKIDFRRVLPVIWATGGDFNYYRLGDRMHTDPGR